MTPPLASTLSTELKRKLLLTILESRHGDLREENLNRQGKGHFHVSGRGHEAVAALGLLMQPDDYACPYYRDRALVLGRGVTTRQLALDYMAKRESSSRGRQMPSHYSYPEFHIWSVPTPTASQLLPACGMAWGMQLDGKSSLTLTTVGDAATRQGDFFEAIAFAKERKLPLLMVVEDNGYGISSPTRRTNPLALNVLATEEWTLVDGWDVEQVYTVAAELMAKIRAGGGPAFLWIKMERLASHTSSDDQKIYRSTEELSTLDERDPLRVLKDQLVADGELKPEEFAQLDASIKEKVRADYAAAEKAENPLPGELEANVVYSPPDFDEEIFKPGRYRMGDMINMTLRAALDIEPKRMIFGEDVEDPKGGVFTLTKKLSTDFPEQVFNSPLAESTILGVACGLASYGRRPVFELQFIDFIYPGWNQLVTNLATLRWRTFGKWTCPAVVYAPYGAYLPGGSLWHSQANEAAVAHYPGINVVIPSTPEDAAGLLWTALHGEDPTLVLIPKHMLWVEREVKESIGAIPFGHARRVTEGTDVTVVAWGNTVEKSQEAINALGEAVSVELIDLRSIAPWDREMIEESVRKTGRLIVVQEDTENCSVGQMIISHLSGRPDVWSRLTSPPMLVSKGNVMIGYNPIYEYTALPDVKRIVDAVKRVMSGTRPARPNVGPALDAGRRADVIAAAASDKREPDKGSEVPVTMPVMGEGIRAARIVALLKKPGDPVALDEPLCEVETDKAVYPIESSVAGVFQEWRCAVDQVVDVGREIGTIAAAPVTASSAAPAQAPVAPPQNSSMQQLQHAPRFEPARPAVPGKVVPPALSPSITRRLGGVVPANLQLDAPWQAIRAAREAAKKAQADYSPSLMISWCATRAMEKHAPFRRLVLKDGSIVERDTFDLGVAVALEGDRLGTAVIRNAGELDWAAFAAAYARGVADVRAGRIEDVQAPVNITSLGAFGVETAIPIVVPPAMGTLFIGKSHNVMTNDAGVVFPSEVVTLSLTFDHKVVNGAGAASFLHEVKQQIAAFKVL
ncbi:MAG TPA: thiamine pyrophosphate-dependent enzyme [Opitutaceae bacterium]|nr:thiamine pyrophosphate-dependent enzyme [Opitutaceae bacterium]